MPVKITSMNSQPTLIAFFLDLTKFLIPSTNLLLENILWKTFSSIIFGQP